MLYEYYCNKCGVKKIEEVGFLCACGGEFKLAQGLNGFDPFTPYVSENMGKTPIWIESRSHREQLLKEKKLAILPYRKTESEGYRPIGKDGRKMTAHQYEVAQKRGLIMPKR